MNLTTHSFQEIHEAQNSGAKNMVTSPIVTDMPTTAWLNDTGIYEMLKLSELWKLKYMRVGNHGLNWARTHDRAIALHSSTNSQLA